MRASTQHGRNSCLAALSLLSLPLAAAWISTPGHSIVTPPARRAGCLRHAASVAFNPRSEGLALELDDGTRKSHSVAESTQFVSGFFKGLATPESFSSLLAGLYHVYVAMEEALDSTECDANKALDFPQLRRRAGLEADMAFFFGPGWRDAPAAQPSAAAAKYAKRIREVASGPNPELLIGHLYSRYLGDLFGGQMMAGMAVKSLALDPAGPDGGGLAFYQFEDIDNTKDFINTYYSALNELSLTAAQREAIVEEANLVFALNVELFDELEGNPARAAFAVFTESIVEYLRTQATQRPSQA